MKKMVILTFLICLSVSLSGCAKKSGEIKEEVKSQGSESIEDMKVRLDKQQTKINELQNYKDEQQELAEEKINQDDLAKQKEDGHLACEARFFSCREKFNKAKVLSYPGLSGSKTVGNRTSAENMIDSLRSNIKQWKELSCSECSKYISNAEDQIDSIKKAINKSEDEINKLSKGECKGYDGENPCK